MYMFVLQVAEKLQYVPLREASFNILAHMLLSFQHAPEPFHKVTLQFHYDIIQAGHSSYPNLGDNLCGPVACNLMSNCVS